LAFKPQTPAYHPEENIQRILHIKKTNVCIIYMALLEDSPYKKQDKRQET
jgi:hypothetical protein